MEFSGEVAAFYAAHRRGLPAPAADRLVAALGLPADARRCSTWVAGPGS